MGLRFRRSVRVLPGVRLNVGLKSASVSFGRRGFHYTMGTQGRRVTAGIPGTGLSWTEYASHKSRPWSVPSKRAVIVTFMILAITAFAIWPASTPSNRASGSMPANGSVAIGTPMYSWQETGSNSVVPERIDVFIPLPRPRPRPKIDPTHSLPEPLKLQ